MSLKRLKKYQHLAPVFVFSIARLIFCKRPGMSPSAQRLLARIRQWLSAHRLSENTLHDEKSACSKRYALSNLPALRAPIVKRGMRPPCSQTDERGHNILSANEMAVSRPSVSIAAVLARLLKLPRKRRELSASAICRQWPRRVGKHAITDRRRQRSAFIK